MSDDTIPPIPEPSAALLGEVDGDLASIAATRRRALVLIGSVVVISVALFAAYHRDPPAGTPIAPGFGQPMHWTVVGAFVALGIAFIGLGFGLWFPTRSQLRIWAGVGIIGYLGLLVATSIGYEQLGVHQEGYLCLAHGSGIGLVLGVTLLLGGSRLLRQRAPTGGLLGLGVGILSLAPLHLVCIDASMTHLLFWHGATPILCALVVTATWVLLGGED